MALARHLETAGKGTIRFAFVYAVTAAGPAAAK